MSAETITYVVVLERDGDKQIRYAGPDPERAAEVVHETRDYCRTEMWAGSAFLGTFDPKPMESRW